MQFSDNEIIALLFGTSLSEPRGMHLLLQLVPAVNQERSATNSGDGKTLTLQSRLPLKLLILISRWPACRKLNEIKIGSRSAKKLKKNYIKILELEPAHASDAASQDIYYGRRGRINVVLELIKLTFV
jgi:hypothetical protein